MTVTLRGWQARAQPVVLNDWAPGLPAPMVVACTGSGKTIFGLDTVIKHGGRVVWLAHRKELLEAPLANVRELWPELAGDAGIVQAGRNKHGKRLVFASIDTLRSKKRLEQLLSHGHPDVVVVDEAHHSVASTYDKVIRALVGPDTRVLGLTATPDREGTGDLSEHWRIVAQYGIVDAVSDGVLLPPYLAVDRVPSLDLSEVGGRRDYSEADLGRALLKARIVEHTVAAMGRLHDAQRLPLRDDAMRLTCKGRQGFVFTATVEQAELTAEALRADGWKAAAASGETSPADRVTLLKRFRAGEIDVLCNPAIFTEGTDLPTASFVVLARPTRSWALAIQCAGRGLRVFDGKPEREAFVLDLGGAMAEHSLLGAPVLIGNGCTVHDDGRHRYVPDGCGGGRCDCTKKVSCLAARGPHTFRPGEITCSKCGRERCPESPSGDHLWIQTTPLTSDCAFCAARSINPLAGMVADRPDYEKEPVAWQRLAPGLYGVQLGDAGVCFNLHAGDDTWSPYWVPADRSRCVPLTDGPVSAAVARILTDDVARKARKSGDGKRGGLPHEQARWKRDRQRLDLVAIARNAGLLTAAQEVAA